MIIAKTTNKTSIDERISNLRKKVMQNAITLKKKIKNGTLFKFKPFSIKQKKILTWWTDKSPVKDKNGIIADGSIRAGKTLCMSLSFALWAMAKFNGQNFIMAGKTVGAFRRNVLFWLKLMLQAQGYKIKDRRADNLVEISKGEIINYFYIFGGKDERSQDLVQGITAAGVFLDEVALMPQSFVNQALARCSVKGSKYWFNCNPEGPNHWFKIEWIDKAKEKNILHLHFTMDDNPSLDEDTKERYRKMFVGVFYQRFILGLWVLAEGIIYHNFDKDKHTIDEKELPKNFDFYYVTSDYGITNPQVFLLCGIKYIKGIPHLYLINEYYKTGTKNNKYGQEEKIVKTDTLFLEDYKNFVGELNIRKTIIDPSATSLINLFKENNIKVKEADNTVVDGINLVLNWLEEGRIHIVAKRCPNIIKEFFSYIWDEKAQERGEDKPVKTNDHALDALRYLLMTVFPVKKKGAFFAR